jgi:hypothetical protein
MFDVNQMEEFVMRKVRLLLAVLLLVILASCALEPTWSIDGKWQQTDGTEVIQFSRVGIVIMANGGNALTAHYEFIDPKHIKIDMGSFGALVNHISISKNELTLTNPDGAVKTYRRVN